jgi:hypothetical protein
MPRLPRLVWKRSYLAAYAAGVVAPANLFETSKSAVLSDETGEFPEMAKMRTMLVY